VRSAPFSTRSEHPLQPAAQIYGVKIAAYEGSKVEDQGLPPTGRRRRGLPPLTPLRGEGWRRLRGGLEWRVAPEARESGVGRAAAAVGQRARITGFTPISRCGHLALSSRIVLDVVRGTNHHHHHHHHHPHRSHSLKLIGLAIRLRVRVVMPLPRCIHTLRGTD